MEKSKGNVLHSGCEGQNQAKGKGTVFHPCAEGQNDARVLENGLHSEDEGQPPVNESEKSLSFVEGPLMNLYFVSIIDDNLGVHFNQSRGRAKVTVSTIFAAISEYAKKKIESK